MKELFLSDLHLGSPLFKHDFEIGIMLDGFDALYLVGDIIDTWELPTDVIVSKHRLLIDRINDFGRKRKVVIIHGNHDPSIDKLKRIFNTAEIYEKYEWEGRFIIHGDEYDYKILKYGWFFRLFFPIHWILERLGINFRGILKAIYHSVAEKRDKDYYPALVTDIDTSVIEKYSELGHTVIMGHTHSAKIIIKECFTYVNCGDMVTTYSYVVYDDEEGYKLMYLGV